MPFIEPTDEALAEGVDLSGVPAGQYAVEVAPGVMVPAVRPPPPPAPVPYMSGGVISGGGFPMRAPAAAPTAPPQRQPPQRQPMPVARQPMPGAQQARPAPVGGGGGGYGFRPADRGGPFIGGAIYPATIDQAYSDVETARLAGHISDERAQAIEAGLPEKYRAWEQSLPGMQMGLIRRGAEGEQERGAIQQATYAEGAELRQQEAAYREGQMREEQQRQEAFQQRRARVQMRADEIFRQQQMAIRDMESQRIDPGRAMKGGQGVMASIAVALGALGAGMAKTPNWAFQIIQKRIDNDIAAQRATLEGKRGAISARSGLLGELRAKMGDIDSAENAYRAYMQRQLAQQVGILGASAASVDMQGRAAQLESALNEGADTSEMNLRLQAKQFAVAEDQMKMRALAGMAQRQEQKRQAAQMGLGGYQKAKGMPKGVLWNPAGGAYGILPGSSPKVVEEMQGKIANRSVQQQQMDRAIEIVGSGVVLSPQQSAELGQIVGTWVLPFRKEITGAGGSIEEFEAIERIAGGDARNMGSRALGTAVGMIKRFGDYQQRNLDGELGARGLQPADVVAVPKADDPGKSEYWVRRGPPPQRGATLKPGVAPDG
jgi:hypothetical protein